MAIISKGYAKRLIKAGKAECVGTTCDVKSVLDQEEHMYWVINRYDLQRTDHVRSTVSGRLHMPLL